MRATTSIRRLSGTLALVGLLACATPAHAQQALFGPILALIDSVPVLIDSVQGLVVERTVTFPFHDEPAAAWATMFITDRPLMDWTVQRTVQFHALDGGA